MPKKHKFSWKFLLFGIIVVAFIPLLIIILGAIYNFKWLIFDSSSFILFFYMIFMFPYVWNRYVDLQQTGKFNIFKSPASDKKQKIN